MIFSVQEQNVDIPFHVSVSSDDVPGVETFVDKMISALALRAPHIALHTKRGPRSQFQHYAELAVFVGEGLSDADAWDTWIIFSDDDDLWSPHRVEMFRASLTQAEAADPVAFRRMPVMSCPRSASVSEGNAPATTDDVELMLRDGRAKIYREEQAEYWELAVRLSVLQRFCEVAHPDVLKNPLADTAFYGFARTPLDGLCGQMTITPEADGVWIYSYREGSLGCVSDGSYERLRLNHLLQRAVSRETERADWLGDASVFDLWALIVNAECQIMRSYRTVTAEVPARERLESVTRVIERVYLTHGTSAERISSDIRPLYPYLGRVLTTRYFANLWWSGPVGHHEPPELDD
jgi:hypothetical protein